MKLEYNTTYNRSTNEVIRYKSHKINAKYGGQLQNSDEEDWSTKQMKRYPMFMIGRLNVANV